MHYFLGIDIGSNQTKGVLIDEKGTIIAMDSQDHKMEIPFPGYAEHDAEECWWWEFCKISRRLIEKTKVNPEDIKGVGTSAIAPCCLPLDEQGKPLRKAILYGIDVRAKKQIEDLKQELGEDYILRKYGNPVTSQSIGPKILWIKENEPEIYAQTARFVTSTTYLVAKLTGRYCVDHYTAAYFTPMYDLVKLDWDEENLARFCRKDQLPECCWTDEIAGVVTEEAALATGLKPGTPVIVGSADAAADAVGAGVLNPGDMLLMFGSSLFMINVVPELKVDKRYWAGPYLFRNTYMVASGMSTAGTMTKWFRDELAKDLVVQQEQTGVNAYQLLKEEIAEIPPGSEGLIVLPYFSGQSTPVNDPEAKGVFFGMTLSHTRAHLYQACLETIAYGIEQHLQGYREIGIETKRLIAVGGGTLTEKWMQIVADVTGKKLNIGSVFGASYGDALLAAKATGYVSDLRVMTGTDVVILPDEQRHALYEPCVNRYVELYQNTKNLMHSVKESD